MDAQHQELIAQINRFIRRDPGGRGLLEREAEQGPLCQDDLARGAEHLAMQGRCVVIVTGFYIPLGTPPAAETDGPPGALLLALALQRAGIEAHVLTDEHCWPAVVAAAEAARFPRENLIRYVSHDAGWRQRFFREGIGQRLSHLIAVERVGPSHTPRSLREQSRSTEPPSELFRQRVPEEHWDHCHNMRGLIIDEFTGDTHQLFAEVQHVRPEVYTIGVGDGGNEIGMGKVPWEELARRLSGPQGAWVPCRVATQANILAGTSNWGAYALAYATLVLRGQQALLAPLDLPHEERVIRHMVSHGPAVDGVTRLQEATVDGLPLLTYLQPLAGMRRLLGWE